MRALRSCCKVKGILVISLILYVEVWFNGIKVNVMWLGENECVWWIKWKLWLMCSCGFLEKCENDYRTGNGNSMGSKRD